MATHHEQTVGGHTLQPCPCGPLPRPHPPLPLSTIPPHEHTWSKGCGQLLFGNVKTKPVQACGQAGLCTTGHGCLCILLTEAQLLQLLQNDRMVPCTPDPSSQSAQQVRHMLALLIKFCSGSCVLVTASQKSVCVGRGSMAVHVLV